MITLKKQFSREKSLLYFCMWDRSDRAGYLQYADHDVRHNLFYVSGPGAKVAVYYAEEEMDAVFLGIKARFSSQPNYWSELASHLDRVWDKLSTYVHGTRPIQNVDTFLDYFACLTDWWTAMTVVFFIPDVTEIDEATRRLALGYREQGEKYTEVCYHRMVDFWQRVAPREVVDLLSVVTLEEAVRLLRGESSVAEIAGLRARSSVCWMWNGVVYLLPELHEALTRAGLVLEEDQAPEGVQEVCGSVAQSGWARGRVRLVMRKADVVKVQPGEIIVADMTNPDYVPAMRLAAAIVTDEGGMTCHAGIVARELKKPCVVGTKIATKVFRDGDEVEVDAERGVVRVVHRYAV